METGTELEGSGVKGVDIVSRLMSRMECPNNVPHLLIYKYFTNSLTKRVITYQISFITFVQS